MVLSGVWGQAHTHTLTREKSMETRYTFKPVEITHTPLLHFTGSTECSRFLPSSFLTHTHTLLISPIISSRLNSSTYLSQHIFSSPLLVSPVNTFFPHTSPLFLLSCLFLIISPFLCSCHHVTSFLLCSTHFSPTPLYFASLLLISRCFSSCPLVSSAPALFLLVSRVSFSRSRWSFSALTVISRSVVWRICPRDCSCLRWIGNALTACACLPCVCWIWPLHTHTLTFCMCVLH